MQIGISFQVQKLVYWNKNTCSKYLGLKWCLTDLVFLSFQENGMIPTIFRYDSPYQANPYQEINSDTIHYGFPGQNHNPVLMKSRFKHLENGVHGKSTKRRLHDISIRDFSTMNLLFNHELFNHELFTHELFNHELINHEISKSSGIEKSRTVG